MDNMKKHVANSMISSVQNSLLHKIREVSYEASIVNIEDLQVLIRVREQPIAAIPDAGPRYFRIKVSEQL